MKLLWRLAVAITIATFSYSAWSQRGRYPASEDPSPEQAEKQCNQAVERGKAAIPSLEMPEFCKDRFAEKTPYCLQMKIMVALASNNSANCFELLSRTCHRYGEKVAQGKDARHTWQELFMPCSLAIEDFSEKAYECTCKTLIESGSDL